MATLLSRSSETLPNSNSSSPQLQRNPSRKSSFLSLRRDKKSISSIGIDTPVSPSAGRSRTGDKSFSPSSFHHTPDASRPVISRPSSIKDRVQGRKSSKSISYMREEIPSMGRQVQEHREDESSLPYIPDSYLFPSDTDGEATISKSRSRVRTRSGPSQREVWEYPGYINGPPKYSIVDSASSVLSQYEDTPQTPIDDMSFRDRGFAIPVVVAAPISGVETMDALVDGMNHHYGDDDRFMGMGGMGGRSKVSKSGFHPLYHPPLPTPPPGVVLGKARPRQASTMSRDSDEDDDNSRTSSSKWSDHPRRRRRAGSSRTPSITTLADTSLVSRPPSSLSVNSTGVKIPAKTVAPSISDIIRAHAPPSQQIRSRKTSYGLSQGHATLQEQTEPDSEAPPIEELVSRSSADTIAEEVRRTILNQKRSSISPRSLRRAASSHTMTDTTRIVSSPHSDGRRESSLFSFTTISDQPPLPEIDFLGLTKVPTSSPSQAIAQYLRSARLTTLLTLTRRPHASGDTPLTVSLSDLGSPTGVPVVVFLGLGCVRHIMGLYDEMAECLGIRLITIDRWGLGRTDTPRSKTAKGIPEWASVVEEVLDRMHIDQCSVMAHSAGAPYALAFASRYPERIRGDICLLAPWVGGGEGSGYRWLKYVPNGILKTAQAAEWKIQAWMIGKPPTFAFEGIGYDVKSSPLASATPEPQSTPTRARMSPFSSPPSTPAYGIPDHLSNAQDAEPRPSMSSGIFSEYDDLRDFEGRFDSESTLERRSTGSQRSRALSDGRRPSKKPSRGFLGRLKVTQSSPQSYTQEEPSSSRGKKLKALRSMSSLKGKPRPSASQAPPSPSAASVTSTPKKSKYRPDTASQVSPTSGLPFLPPPSSTDTGLGLDNLDWMTPRSKSTSTPPTVKSLKSNEPSLDLSLDGHSYYSRANGRRSVSLGASERPVLAVPPVPSIPSSPQPQASPNLNPANFQVSLGNALIAASHAESAKGTHGDLVQILNHDRQPWGFSYTTYPHTVRVWYGDKDERIAENAVRWMETTMGPDKCHVQVVKGADHALMFRSGLVVDILEEICEYWRDSD
ncbi:hypothetical protein B0H21DRAFT_384841 [Amylocystis lapponica]|nr:hypothetical protein B0H21DRAFT_384841 [Amylocystis lapponica]